MAAVLSWNIADFKALGDAHLELPHLTVLAGANSSGKSSLIQSLLLVAQSVNRGGSLILNGPLVRLGRPEDVVRDGQLTIQFVFKIQVDVGSVNSPKTTTLDLAIALGPDPEGSALVTRSFEITNELGEVVFSATSERLNTADLKQLNKRQIDSDVSILRVTRLAGRKAPNRLYLGMLGLTPVSLTAHKDPRVISRHVRMVLDAFIRTERLPFELAHELSTLVRREAFLKEIGREDLLDQEKKTGKARQSVTRWASRDIDSLTPHHLGELLDKAASVRAQDEWVSVTPGYSPYGPAYRSGMRFFAEGIMESGVSGELDTELTYLAGIATAFQEFSAQLRYLGPLREEPRVVHGAWDERVDSLPVGIRGELTAEVLTRRQNEQIVYRDWENNSKQGTLPDAVSDWSQYLGIGDHIEILDLGKLGRGVNLRVNGVERDLTTIGVGASQLLPIIVAVLSAPTRSILLLEQPELHLHPRVQSRLADFFLYAKPGVRFVVETHSEYLITRLRRRVAEQRFSPRNVAVLFAEQKSDATVIRQLNVSELGDFDEWPAGFFDAQEDDARHIVRAIAGRLRNSKS